MSGRPDDGDRGWGAPGIGSVPELMAYAIALETEAEQRYRDLADQMETHNNPDVARLFATLSRYEGEHAQALRDRAGAMEVPSLPEGPEVWPDPEPPENVDVLDVHYLMAPVHALRQALGAERRARAFYESVAEASEDQAVRRMAEGMAEEEAEHVRLVEEMLARYPEPEAGWDDDPDPPVDQE